MNIGIDKSMVELGMELRKRGFHVIEMDYSSNSKSSNTNNSSYSFTNNTFVNTINNPINSNSINTHGNIGTRTDICIYCEDASKHDYFDCINNKMLRSFIPNNEGALLINSSNKTIDEIIHIIEARVYSPIF